MKPPSAVYPRGHIRPGGVGLGACWQGPWMPVWGRGPQLFRITSCLGFSLIYLSLSLDEPCGFCLQDEGKWEEGEKAKRQPPHAGQAGNHSVSQWPGPFLRITRHLPS